ncbi:S-layer homology domain-containing protein [Paenibacillus yanchengensis]|uniref:S-layer homology domain-containing protein n=1 Tax=Paenibacillus yanchengensis TaxID=2035833 RepID=A0ABW4YR15_9BACL
MMKISKRTVSLTLVISLLWFSLGMSGNGEASVHAQVTPFKEVIIGDFETDMDGWITYFPTGVTGDFSRDEGTSKLNHASAKLSGNFESGGSEISIQKDFPENANQEDVVGLSFWIKTDDADFILVRVTDNSGQTHQAKLQLERTSEWQKVELSPWSFDEHWSSWGEVDDGELHFPLLAVAITVPAWLLNDGKKAATVWLDEIALLVEKNVIPPGVETLPELPLGNFESVDEEWELFLPPNSQGDWMMDQTTVRAGSDSSYSAKLTGDFTAGGYDLQISRQIYERFAPTEPKLISFWVKTEDAHSIVLRLDDGSGQTHQQTITLEDTTEWQQVIVTNPTGGNGYSHWGGANDGQWHSQLTKIALNFNVQNLKDGKQTGTVWFDDIMAKVSVPVLELVQKETGNVFTGTSIAAFDVLTSGDQVMWEATNLWGQQVSSGQSAVVHNQHSLAIAVPSAGYYKLKVTALLDGIALATKETTFATLTEFDLSTVDDSVFGVQTHFAHTWSREVVPLVRKAGVKHLRDEIYWSEVELEKDVFTFVPKFNTYMQSLANNHIKPLITLDFVNQFYDGGDAPYTNVGREGYARYAREVLEHYGEQIEWVEIWNEWNLAPFSHGPGAADVGVYFELMKAAYEKIKHENVRPDVTVLGAATSDIPFEWLEQLFQLGGLQYMDKLSIHPYVYPRIPEENIAQIVKLNNLMKQYNNDEALPIWYSEIGWPTHQGNRGVDEQTQAAYLIRNFVVAIASGIEKIFWYDLKNDGTDKTYNEDNFGLIHHETDVLGSYTPKPGYVAMATVTRQLSNAEYVERKDTDESLHWHQFDQQGVPVHVIWSLEPTNVKLEGTGSLEIIDMMGGTKQVSDANLGLNISLAGNPLFVRGQLEQIKPASAFDMLSQQSFVNQPVQLTLVVDNTLDEENPLNADFRIGQQSYMLSAEPAERKTVTVELPPFSQPGKHTVTADVFVNNVMVGVVSVEVLVQEQYDVEMKHVFHNNKEELIFNIHNYMPEEKQLQAIKWNIGSKQATYPVEDVLLSDAISEVNLPLDEVDIGNNQQAVFEFVMADGTGSIIYEAVISKVDVEDMLQIDRHNGQTFTTIDLSEGHVNIPNYGGAADLSGTLELDWDDDNLYITGYITDNHFAQPYSDGDIWQGDSVQFAVSSGMPGDASRWFEYGMALTSNGAELYRWQSTPQLNTGQVTNTDLDISRDEETKKTIYKLALPWSELKPIKQSDGLISISFVVNDNDGNGRKGWIEWGSGIAVSKNSALFVPALLVAPPMTTATLTGVAPNGVTTGNVTMTLSTQAQTFEIAETQYSIDNGETWVNYDQPVTFSNVQSYNLLYRSSDHRGNIEQASGIQFTIKSSSSGTGTPIIPTQPANGNSDDSVKNQADGDDADSNSEPETSTPSSIVFTDISGHWADKAIQRAVQLGIAKGYTDGTFKPDKTISREEFIVLLMRVLELNEASAQHKANTSSLSFTDNGKISNWAKSAVALAVELGLITGYEDGNFRPHTPISRAQMAVIFMRALDLPQTFDGVEEFADFADVPNWAKGAVQQMARHNLMVGRGGNRFVPGDTATRAEAIVVLLNMIDYSLKDELV